MLFLLFFLFILVKKVLKEILQTDPDNKLNLKQKIGSKSEPKIKIKTKLEIRLNHFNNLFVKTGTLLL